MKAKYFIIILLVILLFFSIRSMLKIEDKIRTEKIKYIPIYDDEKALFTPLGYDEIRKVANECDYYFISEGDYFRVLNPEKDFHSRWEEIFFKGVNIGTAVPGKFPTEFTLTFDEYLEWFSLISEMNSNVIRIYTILPPEFYHALLVHNQRHYSKKLYLFQGVWTELPDDANFYDNVFKRGFQEEIMRAIDVIHGQAVIRERRGHASGVYSSDISKYVAGLLIGREWEPDAVEKTNRLNNISSYNGNFISVHKGNAMEVWLGELMDFAIQYETQTYKAQCPVTFVNWLPLDPLYHSSEYIEAEYVREYDNDLEYLDYRNFHSSDMYKTGFFASYHVYPYYPDFIYNEPKYANSIKEDGTKDNFYFYLLDLKSIHEDIPLLISEYGLPSSRGNSHQTPLGFDQGGHSEQEQADLSVILTRDIFETQCAGAIYFEWIDEWFKYNWLVMDFERPAENRRFWHNLENPEQNYGIYAFESRTKTMDGKIDDWDGFNISDKLSVQFDADEGYFYILAHLPSFDFAKNNFLLAIDVYDKGKGEHFLPMVNYKSDIGFEFLAVFNNHKKAELLVDDYYSIFTDRGKQIIPGYSSVKNDNGIFLSQYLLANRKRESVTGDIFPELKHNRGILTHNNSSFPETSNADWFWNPKTKILEARITWQLLNVTDPSTYSVMDNNSTESEEGISITEGFNMIAFITDKENKVIEKYPKRKFMNYLWEAWEEPSYQKRLKPIFSSLQKEFRSLKPVLTEKVPLKINDEFFVAPYKDGKRGAAAFIFKDNEKSIENIILPSLETFRTKAAFIIAENQPKEDHRMELLLPVRFLKKIKGQKHDLIFEPYTEALGKDDYGMALKYRKSLFESLTSLEISDLWCPVNPPFAINADLFNKSDFSICIAGDKLYGFNTSTSLYIADHIFEYKYIDSLIKHKRGNYLVPFIRPDEQHSLYGTVSGSYKTEKLHRIIRIFRNNDYWLTTPSHLLAYTTIVKNARIKKSSYKNLIFITLDAGNIPNASDYTIDVVFRSSAKKIRVENSYDDGIYNLRNNEVVLTMYPNKEVTIEIIE